MLYKQIPRVPRQCNKSRNYALPPLWLEFSPAATMAAVFKAYQIQQAAIALAGPHFVESVERPEPV